MKIKQSVLEIMTAQMKLKSLQALLFLSLCLTLSVYAQNDNYKQVFVDSYYITDGKVRQTDQPLNINYEDNGASGQLNATKPNFLIADPTCAGVVSPGNPYPCCDTSGNAVSSTSGNGLGNCTFAAWYHAKRFWGYSMPTWGGNGASDAKYWFDKSKASGLPTSLTPALYSIAVSSTMSTSGHVAWVMEIRNNDVLVFEQFCGSGVQGITQTWRPISTFNKGFILSPNSAPSPTLTQATNGPILHSGNTQPISFNQTNVNPGMRVVVIFPNGSGRTTLKDAQLSLSGGILTTYVTLGTAGTYQFQVFNENGKYSGMTNVIVN
ncbi:MAG: CHAP domain-containing protein [Pyrinomonadaceae bacterium]|nr:CHAP domain-containing protein [Pyrinomonadaceae bacterium]